MKFLIIGCLAVFCLAHIESVRERGTTLVSMTSGDKPLADFIGGGTIQDSCLGEVSFSSKLNHNGYSNSGFSSKLDNIRYEVTLSDGEKKVFENWYWKATQDFMNDYRKEYMTGEGDHNEDMDLGYYGYDDGWQEECEYRSTDISQCDRVYWRRNKHHGILTGEGDPQNPIYYEITFNSKTKDGCTQEWTDRLVFKLKTP